MKYKWTRNYTQTGEPVQSINKKTEDTAFGFCRAIRRTAPMRGVSGRYSDVELDNLMAVAHFDTALFQHQ